MATLGILFSGILNTWPSQCSLRFFISRDIFILSVSLRTSTDITNLIGQIDKWKYRQHKIMPFRPLCCESEAILSKKFRPGPPRQECSYERIFTPVTEISVTGPARLLVWSWTHRNFHKGKSGDARFRKPSLPGWLGSYEEALNVLSTGTITNIVKNPAGKKVGFLCAFLAVLGPQGILVKCN